MRQTLLAVVSAAILAEATVPAPAPYLKLATLLPTVQATDVAYYNNFAYLITDYQGARNRAIRVYDMSDEANPVITVGFPYPSDGALRALLIDGGNLYVGTAVGMDVFSLAEPRVPVRHSRLLYTPGCVTDSLHVITASPDHVFTVCKRLSRHYLNTFRKHASSVISVGVHEYIAGRTPTALLYFDSKVYASNSPSHIHVFDVTNARFPIQVATWYITPNVEVFGFTHHDGYLYAATNQAFGSKVVRFDLSTGTQTSLNLLTGLTGQCNDIVIEFPMMYVACGAGLYVLEFLTDSTFALHFSDNLHAGSLAINNGHLSVAGVNDFRVYVLPDLPLNLIGCFKTNTRFFTKNVYRGSFNSPGSCAKRCEAEGAGYTHMGVEFGKECWCGKAADLGTTRTLASQCNMPCTGDSGTKCGGSYRMNVYKLGSVPLHPVPQEWGCFKTEANDRKLTFQYRSGSKTTVEECTSVCTTNLFLFAGLENGNECWCGNSLAPMKRLPTSQCSKPCTGDATQNCGDAYKALMFYTGGTPFPTPSSTYEGCYKDGSSRTLSILAYQSNDNSIEECTSVCFHNGFQLAGLQYRKQCWCGNTISTQKVSDSQCHMSCSGDTSQKCGGSWRNSVYAKAP